MLTSTVKTFSPVTPTQILRAQRREATYTRGFCKSPAQPRLGRSRRTRSPGTSHASCELCAFLGLVINFTHSRYRPVILPLKGRSLVSPRAFANFATLSRGDSNSHGISFIPRAVEAGPIECEYQLHYSRFMEPLSFKCGYGVPSAYS